jgi:hypothetical protein
MHGLNGNPTPANPVIRAPNFALTIAGALGTVKLALGIYLIL